MTEAAPSQLSIGRKADRYRLMPTLVKTDAELNYIFHPVVKTRDVSQDSS